MKQQLDPLDVEYLRLGAELAKTDPWYWLLHFTFTQDEHDPSVKYKPFPIRACYRLLARAWFEFEIMFMEKSRQMMISWISCALVLRDAMFMYNYRAFLQSEKDDKAQALIARQRHMLNGVKELTYPILGEWLPAAKMKGKQIGTNSILEFPEMSSVIEAIAQGPEQVPSYTLSFYLGDEIDLQPKFEKGWGAAAPAIQGGGRAWSVGSVYGYTYGYTVMEGRDSKTHKKLGPHKINSRKMRSNRLKPPGHLNEEQIRLWTEKQLITMDQKDYNDIPFAELAAITPGIDYWRTITDIDCLRFHYTSDPYKDPVTQLGRQWCKEMKRKFITPAAWHQHMEMSRDTFEGRPVIVNWDYAVFVKPVKYDSEIDLLLSFDFGTIKNYTLFGQYVPIKVGDKICQQLQILNELVLDNSDTPTQAAATVEMIKMLYQRSWSMKQIKAFCDPTGDHPNETTADKSLNTSIKVLKTHGIYPSNRKFGCRESTELIETVFSLQYKDSDGTVVPAIIIDPQCEYLIKCCAGGLRYPERGKGVPGHYIKDGIFDHGGDGLRYKIANCFTQYDLTGMDQPQYYNKPVIYDMSTGRKIGYKESTRVLPISMQDQRGVHRIHG